jgi:hypothetical protein
MLKWIINLVKGVPEYLLSKSIPIATPANGGMTMGGKLESHLTACCKRMEVTLRTLH